MRFRVARPSPAMVVAVIALFVALGGTSVAAIDFARNAGAVDGKSAVYSGASTRQAAGKLVATNRGGSERGQIPGKFLAGVARASGFGQAVPVNDNAVGAPLPISSARGFGTLTLSCNDDNPRAGAENPGMAVSFVNQSGDAVNIVAQTSAGDVANGAIANGTQTSIGIRGTTTFSFRVERRGENLRIDGVIRQDGLGTPAANCVIYGTSTTVR